MTGLTPRALEAVRAAPNLLAALHRGPALEAAAAGDACHETLAAAATTALLEAATDSADHLTGALATLALGSVASSVSANALVDLLAHGSEHLRDHAVWALGRCPMPPEALPLLAEVVVGGGFTAMLAQRTLAAWAVPHLHAVGEGLAAALKQCPDPNGRTALVETLGLLPGSTTDSLLRQVASDETEGQACRAAAVAALGDTPWRAGPEDTSAVDTATSEEMLRELARGTTELAPEARLALHDLETSFAGAGNASSGDTRVAVEVAAQPSSTSRDERPLTVGQLFLHADVDGDLSHAGRADTGGIATLLVQLGDALLEATPGIERVLTISRGRAADALDGLTALDEPGHHYVQIPLWGPNLAAAMAWPRWAATRRGLRRILRTAPGLDVLHLRMGDVATLAATEVAAERGLPVVFTHAPDPNGLIASRDEAGTLTRANFGAVDMVEHLVFRERLLHDLQQSAAHLVLFPRPDLRTDMRSLMNLDVDAEADRVSVVAEGISLSTIDNAAVNVDSSGSVQSVAVRELDELLSQLPDDRRGLPLVVSVGRLSRVKGMATLVEAWAEEGDLDDRSNLMLVGGDLTDPTDDERQQLAGIDAAVPRAGATQRGLLLPGHRPNATVAAWLAAVRRGRPGLCAPAGIYVSASLKEEFGIAILEAMASGLVVVAPNAGGPATYVSNGVTGILANTASRARLGEAMQAALDLAALPGADDRAAQAGQMVRDRFGIDTMADALSSIYHRVASQSSERAAPAEHQGEGRRS